MTKKRIFLTVFAIILAVAAALGYMWHINRGELPDGHFKAFGPQLGNGHLDLLLVRHGGMYFNHLGQTVNVYMAQYHGEELVLHQLVTSLAIVGDDAVLSGSMFWGLTTKAGVPDELRVQLAAGGGASSGYFDFSRLGFGPTATAGPFITDGPIEPGVRYVMHVWQTGNTMGAGGDAFHPEALRRGENTAILYLVFY
ncbi:MAG: hypothetical protein FWC93_02760 [Defluviitaleaceae bacterium]|nr:hypothetical protein [Defluviitaleaceae bacterium]